MIMNNLVAFPLLIPLLAGLIMAIYRKSIPFQRWFSLFSFSLICIISFYLIQQVSIEGIQILELGGWQAPFGIVLVVDMLSALLYFIINKAI
jgi:multicomponent Na+:H+ antiporter subunit D